MKYYEVLYYKLICKIIRTYKAVSKKHEQVILLKNQYAQYKIYHSEKMYLYRKQFIKHWCLNTNPQNLVTVKKYVLTKGFSVKMESFCTPACFCGILHSSC